MFMFGLYGSFVELDHGKYDVMGACVVLFGFRYGSEFVVTTVQPAAGGR